MTMTQERWSTMSPAQRDNVRDLSGLSPQLILWRGWRVEVTRTDGTVARFIVGQSTGWRPCSLEVARRNSSGGSGADRIYKDVRPLYRVREAT